MFKSLLLFLCLLVPVTAKAEVLNANQILESTCRVTAGQYFGSGSCIKYENGKYFILTNAHVVGSNNTVYLEFFKNGRKTQPFPAEVVWKKFTEKTSMDFAIIAIDEKYFGKYPPRVAKLAPASAQAFNGYIVSAGCPGARWPSAFEGFIISQEADRILFYPPPLGGQSGSGLYIVAKNPQGEWETYLKGVVTWRIGGAVPGKTTQMGYEMNHGGAALIDVLVSAYGGQVSEPATLPDNYETVVFDRLRALRFSPSQHNMNLRPVQPTPRPQVKPKVETKVVDAPIQVTVPEPVIDKTRLLPIIRPDQDVQPNPTPNPLPSPDGINPNPNVNPTDNPYDVIPDLPSNNTVPPIVQEQQDKEKLEAEKAKAEAEKQKAEEEAQWYKDLYTYLGGGGAGTALLFVVGLLYKKGYFSKYKVRIETRLDSVEGKVAEKLTPIVGAEAAESIRQRMDAYDDVIQAEVERRLNEKFGVTTSVVNSVVPVSYARADYSPVSMSTDLTVREAQNTVLNPVAQAIFTEEANLALKDFINRIVVRALKNEQEGGDSAL